MLRFTLDLGARLAAVQALGKEWSELPEEKRSSFKVRAANERAAFVEEAEKDAGTSFGEFQAAEGRIYNQSKMQRHMNDGRRVALDSNVNVLVCLCFWI